jgi:HNH endonuclease
MHLSLLIRRASDIVFFASNTCNTCMKKIPLHGKYSKGKFVKVDDCDFEYLSQFKWYAAKSGRNIYPTRHIRKHIRLHHELFPVPKGMVRDHISGDTLDCTRANLRAVTVSQNSKNRRIGTNNTSGFKGVGWRKDRKKWRAEITVNNKRIILGLFNNKADAVKSYQAASRKYHREFARTNLFLPHKGAS